jgi:uncharacterized membrane protein
MIKLFYGLVLAVCGAILAHIAIIYLVPRLSEPKLLTELQTLEQTKDPIVFSGSDKTGQIAGLDPFFRYRVCFYDLEEGPFQLISTGDVPFFSAALVSEKGEVLFSITDRQTINRTLNIEVRPSSEQQSLTKGDTEASAINGAVPVFVANNKGYTLVRAFVPDQSWEEIANDFLENLVCQSGSIEN